MNPNLAKKLFSLSAEETTVLTTVISTSIIKASYPKMEDIEISKLADLAVETALRRLPEIMEDYHRIMEREEQCLN